MPFFSSSKSSAPSPKQKPKPARRPSAGGSASSSAVDVTDGNDDADPPDSPRDFLTRRNGFNEKLKLNQLGGSSGGSPCVSPAPAAAATDRPKSGHNSGRGSINGSGSASARGGVPSSAPPISPLRLDRLMAGAAVAAASNSQDDEPQFSLRLPGREAEPSSAASAQPFVVDAASDGDAAVALGAAPLSGFRSGRFTPRGGSTTPRGGGGGGLTPRGGGGSGSDAAALAAAVPPSPSTTTSQAASDAALSLTPQQPISPRSELEAATSPESAGGKEGPIASSAEAAAAIAAALTTAAGAAAAAAAAAVAAAASGGAEDDAAEAEEEDDDDGVLSAESGELRAFCLRGPPLPPFGPSGQHGASDSPSASAATLPRSFWDACTVLTSAPTATTATAATATAATTASPQPVCWPAAASPPEHLRFFCFPESLIERLRAESSAAGGAPDGFGFTFSFTASDGAVRWGCAVTGADAASTSEHGVAALSAVSVALVSDWPLARPMLEACKQLFRFSQSRALSSRELHKHMRTFASSLAAASAEVTFLMQHPLWLPTPLAPLLEAAKHSTETLLLVFLAALLERPMLLVSSSVSRLMPAAAALAHTLSPLSYSGTFIPLMPAALHPDPATLVNCSPNPFIIGYERAGLPQLQPIAEHVLIFDLDDGSLAGAEALAELRAFTAAPILRQLSISLQRFGAGGGAEAALSASRRGERGLQGVLLSFMRELLSVQTQSILRSSGDSLDVQRANECAAALELADDVLRCTADLKGQQEAIGRRVRMCQADALVRITASRPQTPTCLLLSAAYESRTVREFLLTPEGERGGASGGSGGGRGGSGSGSGGKGGSGGGSGKGSFADASWMASGLDAEQSIAEHGQALDGVETQLEQRLSSGCPLLLSNGLVSPRTANFQQRFEVGVSETLLGAFGCAIHFEHGLRQGVLHIASRHLCFEAALHPAASTEVALHRVASAELSRDPLFHLIPNAIKLLLDDGGSLVFASFQHREEAFQLLTEHMAASKKGGGGGAAAGDGGGSGRNGHAHAGGAAQAVFSAPRPFSSPPPSPPLSPPPPSPPPSPPPTSEHEAEPISQAAHLLSTVLHCRKQADALSACVRQQSSSSSRRPGECAAQEAAYTTCSHEHVGLVVQHLVKVADRYCPSEVDAFQRCKLVKPGNDCEREDLSAMRCAARTVLAAARAPP